MSHLPNKEPLPELRTTKIGGGRSARIITLAVVVVLAGVVWVGVSGRQAPAPAASPAPTRAASPTPSDLTLIAAIKPTGAQPVYNGYGVELDFGGRVYPASLYELSSGILSARYRVPNELAHGVAALGLARVISSVSHDIVTPIGSWTMSLDPPETGELLLNLEMGAIPNALSLPLLVQQGYGITVAYAAAGENIAGPGQKVLSIEVDTRPFPRPPAAAYRYTYTASVHIAGGQLRSTLVEEPGEPTAAGLVYSGSLVIDTRDVGQQIDVDIGREWNPSGQLIFETFDTWTVDLKPLRRAGPSGVDLAATSDAPDSAGSGYSLTFHASQAGTQITFNVTLAVSGATR